MNFRQRLERFMHGRYGTDKLGMVIVWIALGVMIVNSFLGSFILYLIELFLIFYSFFRMFSKNIGKRYQENRKFEMIINKISSFFKLRKSKWKDRRAYVFTKCPHCKANLRLPRKKGQHIVNCPRCNKKFEFNCK